MPQGLYKLCEDGAWRQAQANGQLPPSDDDRRDGFIHLSFGSQLIATLQRHFRAVDPLWLLELASEALSPGALLLEPSRGGALFPHLHGTLPLAAVVGAIRVVLDAGGGLRAQQAAGVPGND